MRPEASALRVLSTTRAKAKMFEFQVPLEDHIELPRNPDILFSLADGIALRMLSEPERDYGPTVQAGVACVRTLLGDGR